MEKVHDSLAPSVSLVHLAVDNDDAGRLIAAAEPQLGRPLGLTGPSGEGLGYAPDDDTGRRALAVATASARSRLVAPPGWTIIPIAHGGSRLGFLAAGTGEGSEMESRTLLELVCALVAEQLHRMAFLRASRVAFIRRVVSDPRLAPHQARCDAAELGLVLADAYWPAILVSRHAAPTAHVVETVEREARRAVPGSLTAAFDGRIVLLYPGDVGEDGPGLAEWLGHAVALARTSAPASGVQGIVSVAAVELAGLSAQVARLEGLRRFVAHTEEDRPVVSPRRYALERLLSEQVGAGGALGFVDEQLGPLIVWDREHRTDLLPVLEAALDFPRHDQVASRCFLHRNTFRHRLRQATDVLGDDLQDPEARLAVHVACKLRRLLAVASSDERAEGPPVAWSPNGRRRRLPGVRGAPAARPGSRLG